MTNLISPPSAATTSQKPQAHVRHPYITRATAQRVLTMIDHGLSHGLGQPIPGQMCIEAAVSYALNQRHTDRPDCVSGVLRAFKIRMNDSHWSSAEARAKGLRRLGLAQLGSEGALDEQEFIARITRLAITKYLPGATTSAANLFHPETAPEILPIREDAGDTAPAPPTLVA